jgi:outer membrane protein assembly factor BamB
MKAILSDLCGISLLKTFVMICDVPTCVPSKRRFFRISATHNLMKSICQWPLLFCVSIHLYAADTPMFRNDAQHSGVYAAAGVPQLHGVKWKFHTAGQVISSPAVVGDVVYVGSTDHHLYAIGRASGTLKWKFESGSRINSSPAVADGAVYFASYDGFFYALDAASGKLKWKFQTAGEHRFTAKHIHGSQPASESMPDPFDFYLSSPVVAEGVVYFGSGDGNVYALDGTTGAVKWKFATGDVVHASPALADGTIFIGSWDHYLYALDAASGKEKWRFKTGEDHDIHNQEGLQASAVVAGGMVYVGCRDSNFYALDAQTGQQKWVFNNKGSWVIGSAAVKDRQVYFATSDTGLLYALDAQSGAKLFSFENKHWPMFSSPAIAGSILYIGTHEGKLLAFDVANQKPVWVFQTDGSVANGPAYTKPDGVPNYGAAFAGDFYEDIVIGVQKMMSVGAILSSPTVVDDVVYFGSTDGNLYAVN